jgi:hypothetical protein
VGSAVQSAPADFGQLVEDYGGALRAFIRNQLAPWGKPEDVEDTFQYILGQLLPDPRADPPRAGIIEQFDPERVSDYNDRRVSFQAFLMAKAQLYCRGRREELKARAGREFPQADGEDEGAHGSWTDRYGGTATWDGYAGLDDDQALERMREYLAARPTGPGERPLLPLFDEMAARVIAGEPAGPEALRKALDVPRGDMGDYLGRLRVALGAFGRPAEEPELYQVGGLELTAVQFRAAIDALRGYKGHHVLAAFKAAGHPLAGGGKNWYLPIARRELAAYPELRQPAGGHYAGGHNTQVKDALLHWMERELTGCAPAPAPAPRAEPRDSLAAVETALRKLPGATDARVAAALEAVRAAFA